MARLQILELPEGTGDDRPPFILVIDQARVEDFYPSVEDKSAWQAFQERLATEDPLQHIAEKTGARAVLVFEGPIDIPANDTTAYLRDSDVKPELDLKVGDQDMREAVAADMQKMREANEDRILDSRQARLDAQRLADERTGIARDMDRLAKWKNELADALGMDRTRDWDDIRNAARGLRKDRDAKAEAIERVRTTPTEPEVMNSEQESPHVWMHGYRCGVLAARDALRPRSEPTDA